MSNPNQGKPPPMMMEAKRKQRKLPPILRVIVYVFFTFISVSAFCYSSGAWVHHEDSQLDLIISYITMVGAPFTLLFLYFAFLWLESD